MFKNIYKREYYYKKIEAFIDDDMIKVITGIRRCGKSSFMKSIANELLKKGIAEKNIIFIDLNKRGFKNITTPDELEKIIAENIKGKGFKYLFIDEIQNVKNFELVIESFRLEGNISIFITGSNSYLLSGELITKLTGRYIEIEMQTLNFNEYVSMKKFYKKKINNNVYKEFEEYITNGGFPKTIEYDNVEAKNKYVKDVINQIIKKDIKKHNKIKNVSVFDRVMNYIINNFGATMNLTNLLNYFNKEEHLNITQETLYKYINILENAKIINKCKRFDLRSKKSLKGEQKYYLADLSLYFSNNVDARINYGPVLENILYRYLIAKEYEISIGKVGSLECDFIVRKERMYYYLQVTMTLVDKNVEDREYLVFEKIKDNYPKYVFSTDMFSIERDGIINVNIVDFMMDDKDL